ncbi:MAG TPA: hypothetical protein VNT22_06690 [Baekduia sp.]|nr:hypothetical protein [Baekduia sp.]
MSTLAIILLVLVALLGLLFVGGLVAAGRRARRLEPELQRRIAAANEELAQAHALDKGWQRETVEAAATAAFTAAHPGVEIDGLHLIQVIDRPGTDADEAVFHVVGGSTTRTIRLGRKDSQWIALQS